MAEPLTEDEMTQKEEYAQQGFGDWSRRDFQQFVRGLETHGWCDSLFLLIRHVLKAIQGSIDGRVRFGNSR